GVMPISLTTWPIMWADVKIALKQVKHQGLNLSQKNAVRELEFELRYQTRQGMKRSIEFSAASSRALFRNFSSNHREKGEIHKTFDWDGEDFAVKLQSNITTDPGDDDFEAQLDGSYIAGTLGEWVLGVGAIDRWWGPGTQSSLILTNNARPVPGLIFQTKRAQHFDTAWLSWLGNWHFVSFLGQMESNRVIPEAKLTGMRLTFKPFSNLEIGLSRTMQWGGEGREENFSSFWKSLTSQGENEVDGDGGNQIAGFDARLNFNLTKSLPSAVYAQYIGEDEAGYMPAKFIVQVGGESSYALASGESLKGFAEYTNTTSDALGAELSNVAYEHSVFKTGYRYRGRVLAATFDNDSTVFTLGGSYQQPEGQLSKLTLNYMELNEDGSPRGNTVSIDAQSLYYIEAHHQRIFLGGKLKLGISYQSEELNTPQEDIDQTSVFTSWEYRFK
ncbi:MAG: hypothetical protein ACI9T7_003580, partial [Oleiphilaceae bacterium]